MTNKERIIAHNNLIDRAINKANSLPNAGGSTNPTASKSDVNFYDYDGTLLYSYTIDEAHALTELPPLPSRPGLICQGWNYDLDAIKSYNRAVDVGATYITDDGKTRLYIKIAAEGRMTVPLYFSQTVSNGVVIDWGDGTATETLSGTDKVNTSHTYSNIGDYVISLEVTSGTLGLGHNSAGYCVMGSTEGTGIVYCNMLKKVEIGNGVTSIDSYAFYGCYSIASAVMSEGVTSIGERLFYKCSSLASIVIPNSVTSIDTYAFSNCDSLASVIIPNSVASIGNSAFYYCSSLASIVIPNSVTSIGNDAFQNCYSLASIVIHSGVTSIGNGAFSSCNPLSSIVIPDSVTSIGNNAFNSCRSLASVVIPNSVTSIGNGAFNYCSALTSIVIPNMVARISSRVFSGCRSLSSIVIPDSVTSIGDYAFNGCDALTSIVIPDMVTSIDYYAFSYCDSLASIVIPDSVASIGNNAFSGCYGMAIYDFTSHTSVPPLSNTNIFTDIPSDCKIKVPSALYDEWIAATNWSTYANYIVAA